MEHVLKGHLPVCLLSAVAALALSCGSTDEAPASAQKPAFADSLSDLVESGASLEPVRTGLKFDRCGAPCWHETRLFFSNINFDEPGQSRTYRMGRGGNVHLIRDNNGIVTAMAPAAGGTFLCLEAGSRRVTEIDRDGKVLRVVAEFPGSTLHDLAADARGGIYVSLSDSSGTGRIVYAGSDGIFGAVSDGIASPGAIALSADGSFLYAAGSDGGAAAVVRYAVHPDGTLSEGNVFCRLGAPASGLGGGLAGFAVDAGGNLYAAVGDGVQVFNAAGERLGTIGGAPAVNDCAFGGTDLRTLYVTAANGISSLPTTIPGSLPGQAGSTANTRE
jgi:gluconolactonase